MHEVWVFTDFFLWFLEDRGAQVEGLTADRLLLSPCNLIASIHESSCCVPPMALIRQPRTLVSDDQRYPTKNAKLLHQLA